jgi:glutathione S-transferase
MTKLEIIGRQSSHYTRVTRVFGHELNLALELVPIYDITPIDAGIYAGNPARKLPTLRRNGALIFGTENICRTLADEATKAGTPKRIVWPEQLREDVSRNAQELTWHAMAAQVQLVFGTVIGKLPADNLYFVKGRAGFEGALDWLNANLSTALDLLPESRDLSLFEVTLFCLVEHLVFRGTIPLEPYPALAQFAQTFAKKGSAEPTKYDFDVPVAL